MTIGPSLVIACPACRAFSQVGTAASGNTFGATLWTDGVLETPMDWSPGPLKRCPTCNAYFWLRGAAVVGSVPNPHKMNRWGAPPDPDEEPEPEVPQPWRDAPFTPSLSKDDYLDALSSDAASGPDAVRALRILAWHQANDAWRYRTRRRKPRRTSRDLQNIEALLEIELNRTPRHPLLLAELARELGRFDDALQFLRDAESAAAATAAVVETIRERCLARDTAVAQVPRAVCADSRGGDGMTLPSEAALDVSCGNSRRRAEATRRVRADRRMVHMTSQDRTLGHPAPAQPARPVTEHHEGVLIGYDELPDGTLEARLLWSRGDPLMATGATLADVRTNIRATLAAAIGESEAAALLEWSAESLPLGADDWD